MIELSDEQKAIVYAPITEKTIVLSTAASGKTACVVERVRALLRAGIEPDKIVCITFTNNAGEEMRKRLGDDFRDGLFAGTLHSYANMLLISNGIDTSRIREDEDFDQLITMISMYPEVIRPIDYLVCDESQDLNILQFELLDILNPKACLIVGDPRQSIYDFKDARPDLIVSLTQNPQYTVRELTQNYRNAKNILELSNHVIKTMKDVPQAEEPTCMRKETGIIKKIEKTNVIKLIKENSSIGHYGDWAILCRANHTIDTLLRKLIKAGIPAITFRQAQGDLQALHDKMLSDSVKVLTIHSSKGLEFNKVIVYDVFKTGAENIRLNYVSFTRARDELYMCYKG